MVAREWEKLEVGRRRDSVNVYHHLARFPPSPPRYSCPPRSDESLVLLYLSHSDEVELIATFTPADVISVLRPGSRRVGKDWDTCWELLLSTSSRRNRVRMASSSLLRSSSRRGNLEYASV
ncbi:uncharacterized protein V6R79_021382 [Siganus canaliculatus]